LNLKPSQKRDLLSAVLDLLGAFSETTRGLLSYANEPKYSKSPEEYLHGFDVLRQLVDKAEAKAREILFREA
jgi:soluble cytochrome b562